MKKDDHSIADRLAHIALRSEANTSTNTKRQAGEGIHDEWFLLLFLEADKQGINFSVGESALDSLVQHMQPSPAITHVEMLIPTTDESGDEMHFSTYLGASGAAWSTGYGDGLDFYLNPDGNGSSWRAVPVFGRDAVNRIRAECQDHLDTPYPSMARLFNYPFSVPPMRAFASYVDDTRGTAAHCAALTTRILHTCMPELNIPNAAPWYGPSTLYLEIARQGRMVSYAAKSSADATTKSHAEDEEAIMALDVLLRGSNKAVMGLSEQNVRAGTNLACQNCVLAGVDADPALVRSRQKELARATLRDSWIGRPARLANLVAVALSPTPAPEIVSAPATAPVSMPVSCQSSAGSDWVPEVNDLYNP